MAKLECSGVYQTRLQGIFQLAFQLCRSRFAHRHVSILLAFYKIRIPHEKYCKAQKHRLQYSWSPPFPLRFKIDADASLIFLITVKLRSYTSRASAKDLLNFHSLIFFPSNIGGIFDKYPFQKPVQFNVQQWRRDNTVQIIKKLEAPLM